FFGAVDTRLVLVDPPKFDASAHEVEGLPEGALEVAAVRPVQEFELAAEHFEARIRHALFLNDVTQLRLAVFKTGRRMTVSRLVQPVVELGGLEALPPRLVNFQHQVKDL